MGSTIKLMANFTKILFISDNFPPETNAAALRVYERALYWKKWGYEPKILTSFPSRFKGKQHEGYSRSLYKSEKNEGLKIVRVKTYITSSGSFFLRSIHQISFMVSVFFAGLFEKKISVIIATTPQFFCSFSGLLLSKIKKVPFILEVADIWTDSIEITMPNSKYFLSFLRLIETYIYKKSDAIIVLTKGFKSEIIKRGIEERKVSVIRNGINRLPDPSSSKIKKKKKTLNIENKKIIGYLGSLGSAQGLMNVIRTAKILDKENSDIVFLFIGEGDDKPLHQKASKELRNVIFLDHIERREISNYLSLFTLGLAHLKDNKIFKNTVPSKIFEMMSAGLPILLVSPEGEASSIVEKHKVGKWVKSGDPELLAKQITNIFLTKDSINNYSTNSRNNADHYQREAQAKKVIGVIEEILIFSQPGL